MSPEVLADRSRWAKEFDLKGWTTRNGKEQRWEEILEVAKALRAKYKRVGVIGYCFGGWSSFRLGAKSLNPHGNPLVNAISTAHPTWLTKEEMDDVAVPVQIVAPETDHVFNPELKAYAKEVIPTKSVPFDYQHFPGVEHSFATRGNPANDRERKAMVRAKRVQVAWVKEWLHGDAEW